jgi:hypothetical protein
LEPRQKEREKVSLQAKEQAREKAKEKGSPLRMTVQDFNLGVITRILFTMDRSCFSWQTSLTC